MTSSKISNCRLMDLHVHKKDKNDLITIRSIQLERLPVNFSVSPEIYQLYCDGNPEQPISRGNHAHIKKEEIFQVISGSCEIHLDDGFSQHNFQLNSQDNALYVPAGIWHEIRFTQQAVLLVVSSTLYSDAERQADYIEDFDDFLDLKLAH